MTKAQADNDAVADYNRRKALAEKPVCKWCGHGRGAHAILTAKCQSGRDRRTLCDCPGYQEATS